MALETGTYISDLVITNPVIGDDVGQGDDHLRLVKATVKTTFPNITGAVTPTHTQLNFVSGVTSALQTQLDAKAAITYVDAGTSNIQTQLNAKAALASPAFTGTPTVPTATAGTNTTQIASTAFVRTEVAAGSSPGTWTSLSNQAISGASSVVFTQFNSTLFDNYRIVVTDLYGSAGGPLVLTTSTNGGTSYDAGATDYSYTSQILTYAGSTIAGNSSGSANMSFTGSNAFFATTSTSTSCIDIDLMKPSAAAITNLFWAGVNGSGGTTGSVRGAGIRSATTGAVNAIKLAPTGGTVTGTFRLYGQYK